MDMPKVLEQHKKLAMMAGTWVGEETMFPSPWDPKGGSANGKIEGRIGIDGFFLVTDYVQERGGQVTYRGHGVYGWDAQQACYTMHWFDSMGCAPAEPAKGQWLGNTLTFQNKSPMGHGRFTYNFDGEGRYTFRMEGSQDGTQWMTMMEGRYTRRQS